MVTIYHTGVTGSIKKVTGRITRVENAGVTFIPKGCRKEQMIMTYYSGFIMVVPGTNHPDPDGGFIPLPSTNPNVQMSRGRYNSCDPRWVSDFMTGPGKDLACTVLYQDGKLVKNLT